MKQEKKITNRARHLRMQSTEAEQHLWDILRSKQLAGYKFRRQHPIGKYIADFACIPYKLVIELDGGQHADNAGDAVRTAWLEAQGWQVLRFWNNDVLQNRDGILSVIIDVLEGKQRCPHPPVTQE